MINPIYLFSALFSEDIEEIISKSNLCEINWKIEKIQLLEKSECIDSYNFYLESKFWTYNVMSLKWTNIDCSIDGISKIYSDRNFPKVWDEVNFLINNLDNYYILSDKKNSDGSYLILSWNNKKYDTEICTSNSNFIEFHKDYFIIWTWIISLIILWIIIYKKFKK